MDNLNEYQCPACQVWGAPMIHGEDNVLTCMLCGTEHDYRDVPSRRVVSVLGARMVSDARLRVAANSVLADRLRNGCRSFEAVVIPEIDICSRWLLTDIECRDVHTFAYHFVECHD